MRGKMTPLIADALLHDPSFQNAKKEILTTIDKYRREITSPRPPQADLKVSYEETIKRFGHLRGQELFYPYLGSGFGNGALVELADGSVKYDLISGIGTHWGHCHPDLIAASLDAAIQDLCMQGNLQQNCDSYELTQLLIHLSGLDHCILSTSGAMANENALKIIFQKKAPATRILAFERCFMGRTLALSQITDKPAYREGLPHTLDVDYIPFYDQQDPHGSTQRSLTSLRNCLKRYPGAYACMCFELIQGEAGNYPGSHAFFVALFKLLKEEGIAIFIDEVQTFGRTDSLFAFQHFEIAESVDVITCGKQLHACATLFRNDFCPRPGLISQTFISATASIRAAIAITKSLVEEGFLGAQGKNMQIRKLFVDHLQRVADKYPDKLEGPFGYGLMIACTPLKGEQKKVTAFAKALFEAGLITFVAGSQPTRLRFLIPAGGITQEDLEQAALIFEETLRQM